MLRSLERRDKVAAPPPNDPSSAAARLKEASSYIQQLESDVSESFVKEHGRQPSQSEIQQGAFKLAKSEGRSYYGAKNLINSQPGPIRKALGAVSSAVGSVVEPVVQGAISSVADRTQSLRAEDSSLPHITGTLPFAQEAENARVGVGNAMEGVFGSPTRIRKEPTEVSGQFTLGAEDLADAIEVGVPLATEATALGMKNLGPTGRVGSIILGNVASEVGAEYLRYADRKASGLPNELVNSDDPTDVALHFAKVGLGGAALGTADVGFNWAQLRTQRQAYKTAFGLGTTGSNEAIRRMERIGVDPSLSQAMTTPLKLIGTSLSIYPLTGGKAVSRARAIKQGITDKVSSTVGGFADHLMSGIHISERSSGWLAKNDAYLQFVGAKANGSFERVKQMMTRAEAQLGLDQMYAPTAVARGDIQRTVVDVVGKLPPDVKAALEKNPDYEKLVWFIENAGDKMPPSQVIALRNEMEGAASRAGGAHDPNGRVFTVAAKALRESVNNMVAPPAVKAEYEAAIREWSDYHALTGSAAWKAFKMADSHFGDASKVGAQHQISSQAVLQNAMADGDLTPDIVGTWWRAANEGQAVPHFKNAVEAHIRNGFEQSTKVMDKGPLAGVEVIDLDRLIRYMGADKQKSNKWAAHKLMIEKSGGDPDELVSFLEDMKQLFPEGIPNPSATAARRTALSGVGSAVRMLTAGSVMTTAASGGGAAASAATGIGTAIVSMLAMVSVGQLMFNPTILKKMRRVMDGGISEQGRWRTLWNVASSVGATRAIQNALQEQGIDPVVTPTKAEQQEQIESLRNSRVSIPAIQPKQPTIGPR